eukprot:6959478-Karenia_brevis.AAC.1
MLQETAVAIKAIGLEFSDGDGKCQFIALESEMLVPPFLSVNGSKVPHVDGFKILGSWFDGSGSAE